MSPEDENKVLELLNELEKASKTRDLYVTALEDELEDVLDLVWDLPCEYRKPFEDLVLRNNNNENEGLVDIQETVV